MGVTLVGGWLRGGSARVVGGDDRYVRFCLGRFKTPDLKQPRLAGTRWREARVTCFPCLQDAVVATFGLQHPECFCRRPEAIFNYDLVVSVQRRRSLDEEEKPEPMVRRADLVVAE